MEKPVQSDQNLNPNPPNQKLHNLLKNVIQKLCNKLDLLLKYD